MKKIFLVSVAVSAMILGGCAPRGADEDVAVDEATDVVEVEEPAPIEDVVDETPYIEPAPVGVTPIVYFDFDKYNIKANMQSVINAGVDLVRSQAGNANVTVEGHCDEWGTDEYNQALGLRRANSVKRALTNAGLNSRQISVKSYGESQPVCTEKTKECDARNRRAEIKVGF